MVYSKTSWEIGEHVIRKRGSNYVVLDSAGKKTLGTHKTRASALRQIRAIEASKGKKSKKK